MVDSRGDSMNATLKSFAATPSMLKSGFEEQLERTDEVIRTEGEKTRRHFDRFAEHPRAD
jgi:hypothetical protein